MNDLEAKVALNLVLDIGSIRLKKLLEFFGKAENILKASPEKLNAVSAIGQKIAAKICAIKKEDIDKEFALAKSYNLQILSTESSDYPENLKNISDPPVILYVQGQLKQQDILGIAIVGSRLASFYGLTAAEKFAYDLSGLGFTIISGMARGIDTRAHRGALKSAGRTIAVMGSGFANLYPPENKELAQEISRNGAVISEFPINTGPAKQNFPRRNRLISGLSQGVLIVEAAKNSGALITADFALEQGRDVFALPGKVDSLNSFGTNELIKQGAKLVSSVDDILEELPLLAYITKSKTVAEKRRKDCPELKRQSQSLSCAEDLLYNIIDAQPVSLDELVEKTNLNVLNLSPVLLNLQTKKLVKKLPGGQFIRSQDGG
jgi:DNA processing protein